MMNCLKTYGRTVRTTRARDVRELTKCIFMGMFETLFSCPIGGRRKKDGRAPAGRYSFLAIVSSRPREATIIVRRRHASRYDVIYIRGAVVQTA